MNKLRPLALICAGPVSRSPLSRLPQLAGNLTWVKADSLRVASRAVNALGAGSPVAEFTQMSRAAVWIISVPNSELEAWLEQLRAAPLSWKGRVLLILDGEAGSDIAASFSEGGAAVASISPIESDDERYLAEGDRDAIRAVRKLVGEPRRLVEIRKGAKATFLAGAQAVTTGVMPLIAEAIMNFQAAGIGAAEAKLLTESLLKGAMRSYFRAGRRAIK